MTIREATKKPVTIECMQFTDKVSALEIEKWVEVSNEILLELYYDENGLTDKSFFSIQTYAGELIANLGYWIIRKDQGEFYPCKPDIFEATYDLHEVSEVKE